MRRAVLAALAAGVVAAVVVFVLYTGELPAQPGRGDASTYKPPQPQLPISQVVLFSSGVGFFQREGEVDGNARIDMTFPVEDINDLLKSMVLQDLGGGHISAVSYDSHDPIEKTLRSFAINLTDNPTYGAILQQARGEKIEVVLQQTNVTQPGTLTGTIIGTEKQQQPAGKDATVEVEMLNLWCADGMRSIKLSDLQRVRFLNPVIDNELKRALETLALSHDTQKKAVSLNFSGEGKRPVRVSYVVENPIWKTSYRLVIDKQGKKAFLQGWAVVENTSDDDWNNVRMALVSGRPISFQMDLYQPLYVPRPMVEPELFASLRPPTYSGAMEKSKGDVQVGGLGGGGIGGPGGAVPAPPAPAPMDAAKMETRGLQRKSAELADGMASNLAMGRRGQGAWKDADKEMELGATVTSAANATEMGDFFQYLIEKPVSLARQKSAMLPIVNQNVEGSKVSIYNQRVHAKFPLHGLKFKNSTGLHLMQGPITVFEGSSYAGDARIQDLQPNEERLLSYAIDLGTEVEPVVKQDPQRLTEVKVYKGVLHATNKVREAKTYNIKNRSDQDRTLIIEHPYRQGFNLVTPEKPTERSRDFYRFELPVPAGQTAKQEVIEERDLVQQIALTNTDDQTIRFFVNSAVVSDKVKQALAQALELKSKLSATQRDVAELTRQYNEINQDQQRLRANLKELPPTAAAYKRYLEKFDQQETEIEKLQANLKTLRQTENQQRKDYETFLLGLNVE
jgi:ubiquitin